MTACCPPALAPMPPSSSATRTTANAAGGVYVSYLNRLSGIFTHKVEPVLNPVYLYGLFEPSVQMMESMGQEGAPFFMGYAISRSIE